MSRALLSHSSLAVLPSLSFVFGDVGLCGFLRHSSMALRSYVCPSDATAGSTNSSCVSEHITVSGSGRLLCPMASTSPAVLAPCNGTLDSTPIVSLQIFFLLPS